jgi:Peptidase family M28/PA domain
MKPSILTLALILAASPSIAADPATPQEAQLKAHVAFLASDAMQGREAGSREYEIAAEYVASQFMALGLKPVGDNGRYMQTVPLVSTKLKDKGSLTLVGKSGDMAMTFGDEFILSPSLNTAERRLDAPLVFAGFGVVAPERKHDDYAGLDVKGKIVVLLWGAPKAIPSEERAHYSNGMTKALTAEARGAIGIITVETPTLAKLRPFSDYSKDWADERMVWRQPDGTGFQPGGKAPGLGVVNMKGAEKLFASLPGGAAAVMKAAESPTGRVKGRALPLSARIATSSEIVPTQSSNVAALLQGSDPALAAETVVLSAHLDHVGVGAPVKGDVIYNGAMDNAMGTAAMIEVAKRMVQAGDRPKRSVLFLAVTAEEKGLVGADYFARHPTIPRDRIVANVNLDMPILTYRFEDVIAFGADRSTLGPLVRAAVEPLGIALSPDPSPDQANFVRSDHYRFVQQGVPAVFLVTGEKGAGTAGTPDFLKSHYHKPSDEVTLPIDWAAGVKFIDLNLAISRALADAAERPRWNKGDFFGILYNGHGAR